MKKAQIFSYRYSLKYTTEVYYSITFCKVSTLTINKNLTESRLTSSSTFFENVSNQKRTYIYPIFPLTYSKTYLQQK